MNTSERATINQTQDDKKQFEGVGSLDDKESQQTERIS